nr:EOG090X0OE5 [Polyphemus pediculus]
MSVYIQSPISASWFELDKQSTLSYELVIGKLKDLHCVDSDKSQQLKLFNGKEEISPLNPVPWPRDDVFLKFSIPLIGGKGGFGSMLRAIGAQIEKTTNREACRDLSGRRLRDINEEKRLKDWVAKQAEREKEREERKKKKLDKLKEEFHHEFHDPQYFKARSEVTEKVHDAMEQGIQEVASSSVETSQLKRKSTADEKSKKRMKRLDAIATDLEKLGLDHLKCELMRRGLKCGGTLTDRALRLFSIKGLSCDEIPSSMLAKPPKKK